MGFLFGLAVGTTLGVLFAVVIKNWLHRQENQIGAKLKADIAKVVPKV
jgi:hypothetical protein